MSEARCYGCKKSPAQIADLVAAANANGLAIADYLSRLEPTFNPTSGRFMCPDCYIDAGITDPGWRAP